MADVAAPPVEVAEARRRGLRGRLSPWGALVAASTALIVVPAAGMAAWWAATYERRSESLTAKLPTTLLRVELAVGRGDVDVVGGAREEVLVERTEATAFGHEPQERRMIADGVLRIESSCAVLVIGSCRANYRLTVPDNIPVTVAAEQGDVRVSAFRGSAVLSTHGGDIDVQGFCGFVLQATARGGDLEIGTSCAPTRLELRTDSGDVDVAVPPGSYSIDADTNGGTVEVEGVDDVDAAPFTIQALSGSGDVTIEAGS